jgi:hypothetical protein
MLQLPVTANLVYSSLILATKACSMLWKLVTANIVPSMPILVTLMMEAVRSSKTSVLTRATLCDILEDCIGALFGVYKHQKEILSW